ncbi:Hypothetical predicted protein [Octopus vulgaris]|uniref:Uncharacterized protein n=1 Tax=Octopus vulgaris TaxID=6645 RepID=A0AA36BV13_OCTVU|nr:Hypothetical predicted protein [Octopus vulgaris]
MKGVCYTCGICVCVEREREKANVHHLKKTMLFKRFFFFKSVLLFLKPNFLFWDFREVQNSVVDQSSGLLTQTVLIVFIYKILHCVCVCVCVPVLSPRRSLNTYLF